MSSRDRENFTRNYHNSMGRLFPPASTALARTFHGIKVGLHHEDDGMCIIENEKQEVLLILMEKK